MRCRDCGATLPAECNCTVLGGDGITVSSDTVSLDLVAAPELLSCGVDGLLGEIPSRVTHPPRARVTSSVESGIMPFPGDSGNIISWWDRLLTPVDYGFFSPSGSPAWATYLTMPLDGLFGFGACLTFGATTGMNEATILLNDFTEIAQRSLRQRATTRLSGTGAESLEAISMYSEKRLVAGDRLSVRAIPQQGSSLFALGHHSPVFFVTYLSD